MSKLLEHGLTHGGKEFEFVNKLGEGRFATVYSLRCTNASMQTPMAAKVTQLRCISAWSRAQLA